MASGPFPTLTDLPIYCPVCGGKATITLIDWNPGLLRQARWTCPQCGREHVNEFPGVLASVSKRS